MTIFLLFTLNLTFRLAFWDNWTQNKKKTLAISFSLSALTQEHAGPHFLRQARKKHAICLLHVDDKTTERERERERESASRQERWTATETHKSSRSIPTPFGCIQVALWLLLEHFLFNCIVHCRASPFH